MTSQNLGTIEPPQKRVATGWTTVDPIEECRAALHKKAFRVAHHLAGHPLFAVDTLIGVAQEAAKRRRCLYLDAGNVAVTDKWGDIPVPDMPVSEVINRIETAGAWIVLKHVEEIDTRYQAILDEWVVFARNLAGPEGARLLCKPEVIVFITSPHRVTPCHFDPEINWLCQLHGSKDIWICDPNETTQQEIERHYAVRLTSGDYTSQAEARATQFVLDPGSGVHIPTHAKHWVKNHNNVSVSLSLNFEFPRWRLEDIHRANHYLRRLGISPRSPGKSVIIDSAKAAAGAITRSAVVRRIRGLIRR
jgi:hypothetical protein